MIAAFAVLAVLAALVAAPVEVTTTTVAEVRASPQFQQGVPIAQAATPAGYGAVLSRTLVDGSDGDLSAQARLDVDLFAAVDGGPVQSRQNNIQVERLLLRAVVVEGVTIELGDSAVQVGRGLALCLRPAASVGLDSALRGLRLHSTRSDGALSVQAFAGVVNPQNTDPLTETHLNDSNDVVTGIEGNAVTGPVVVGIYGIVVVPEERLLPAQVDGSGTVGVTLQAPDLGSVLDLGLEVAIQQQVLGGVMTPGAAAALDLTTRFGSSTLLIEGLWLRSFAQRGSRTLQGDRLVLAQPPTLERADMSVADVDDARAVRAWLQSEVAGAVVEVTAMGRQNSPESPVQIDVLHLFSLVSMALPLTGSRLSVGGGLRDESSAKKSVAGREIETRLVHGDVDVEAPLWSKAQAHASAALQVVDAPVVDARFARGNAGVGVDQRVGSIVVGGGLELGVDGQRSQAVQHAFAAATGHVDVDSLSVRLVVGDQRGGLRCSGGVCRQVPAFSGARVEVVARF